MLVIFPGNNSVVRHNIRYAHNICWHTNSPKSPNKSKFIDFIDIINNHSHFPKCLYWKLIMWTYIHFEYVNEYAMYVHIYNCLCSMHPCLHILQYTCIHEHPHNKDSIIIFIYILLFCTLYAIVARLYVHLTVTSSHNHILFDIKLQTPPSPVSCRTSVAIIISPNEVFGDIMVLASPPPPVDPRRR